MTKEFAYVCPKCGERYYLSTLKEDEKKICDYCKRKPTVGFTRRIPREAENLSWDNTVKTYER